MQNEKLTYRCVLDETDVEVAIMEEKIKKKMVESEAVRERMLELEKLYLRAAEAIQELQEKIMSWDMVGLRENWTIFCCCGNITVLL